jgi:FERM domain-containing protein 3/5
VNYSGDLGDYDPEEHEGNYVTEHKMLLKQTLKIEEDIMELHQTQMRGQSPESTETNFLRKAYQLDTYGIDPHPVKVISLTIFNQLEITIVICCSAGPPW